MEDDSEVRDAIAEALRLAGHDVQSFPTGGEALAAIECAQTPPSVVLLDLVLPGLGGKDVLKRLRTGQRAPDVPVVVITGTDDDDAFLAPWPVSAVLRKPVSVETLLATLRLVA